MPKLLTEAAIAQYRRDGGCAPIDVLDPTEAAAMRRALEMFEVERGGTLKGSVRFKSHLLLRWLADLVRSPRLLDAVEDLIGPNILCWTSQWWIKEARSPQFVLLAPGQPVLGRGHRQPRERVGSLLARDCGKRVHALHPRQPPRARHSAPRHLARR